MEDMDEFESPEHDSRKLTEEQAKRRKRTQALREEEREEEESLMELITLRKAYRDRQRNDELQREIDVVNMALWNAELAVNVYKVAMACRKQRIKEFKFMLTLVSGAKKSKVQSDFDKFIKTPMPSLPRSDIMSYAEACPSSSSSAPQRAESQRSENSSTRCFSSSEDAEHSSPNEHEEEEQAESISVKSTKRSRRK